MKPQHTKKQLRKISPPDYNYGGFWNGLYHFIKGDYKTGFTEIAANDEDLINGNLEYFAKNGYTRIASSQPTLELHER